MPAVTFAAYAIAQKTSGGSQFNVTQAFTTLSLLNLLVQPVMDLTIAWTTLSSGLACLDRIQAFLLKENREDYRILLSHSDNASFASRMSTEKLEKFEQQKRTEQPENLENPVIKIRGGCFGWKKDLTSAIIKDIDLDIMPGELTLIVGPVASGKTTLLEAIVGEARIFSGSVEITVPEEIAYCGQDAWLLNQSVKENILAFEQYSKDFYDEVVEACQLEEDLRYFPKGDDSIIGSRGISLSGGQKQRVVSRIAKLTLWDSMLIFDQALARAVYNRKPIVILDDVLKGLDADTYTKCFKAILGARGLLRRNRTAIILATHNGWLNLLQRVYLQN
jgi:ATP-binding cassette subfamily C (CFTR/MRP) protein 1